MDEYVLAILAGDEAETFCVVEPLNSALFHFENAPLKLLPRTQCGSAACGAVTRNRQELLIEFWDCKECSMAGGNFVPHQGNCVLVINPGSTSTKFGVFNAEGPEWVSTAHHGDEEIEQFRGRSMLARTGYRAGLIEKALAAAG